MPRWPAKDTSTDDPAPLLSAEEISAAQAEAEKQFRAKKAKEARAKIIAAEIARLEKEAIEPGSGDELVTVVLDLPQNSDRAIIDGEVFYNGQTVTRSRTFVASLLEMMWRGQLAEHALSGRTATEFYRRQRPVEVTKTSAGYAEAETVRVA